MNILAYTCLTYTSEFELFFIFILPKFARDGDCNICIRVYSYYNMSLHKYVIYIYALHCIVIVIVIVILIIPSCKLASITAISSFQCSKAKIRLIQITKFLGLLSASDGSSFNKMVVN